MSLVFVHSCPFPRYSGGIDTWLFHVIEKLDGRGRQVVVFAPASSGEVFYETSGFKNLKIVGLPSIEVKHNLYRRLKRMIPSLSVLPVAWAFLSWPFKTWRVIRQHVSSDDKIIALHTVPTMLPVVLYKCLGGKLPVVCSVRGTSAVLLQQSNRPILAWLFCQIERLVLHFADVVISQGEDTTEYVRERLHKDAVIVPNGVDTDRFAGISNDHFDPDIAKMDALKEQNVAIILCLGTLRDVKGIPYLLQAASQLKDKVSRPFRICFVGKGDPTVYQKMGERYGIAENLLFLGEKKDVVPFVQRADIGVALTRSGGVQHSLLEMMAAGLSMVTWDSQTYSQTLSHGYSGHLVRDGDPVALAEGIAYLLNNREYAVHLGKNAQRAAASHDWAFVAERLLSVVDAV